MISPSTFFVIALAVAVIGVLLDLISTERAANRGFEEDPRTPYRKPDGSPNVRAAWIVNIGGLAALIGAYALGAGYWAGAILIPLGLWRGLVGLRNFRTVKRGTG